MLKNLSFEKEFKVQKEKALKEKKFKISTVSVTGNSILTENKVKNLSPNVSEHTYSKEDLELWAKKIYSIPYIEKVYYEVDNEDIHFTVKEKDSINVGTALNYLSEYGASINISTTIPNFGVWTQNYTFTAELSKYPKIFLNNIYFYEIGNFRILGSLDLGYKNLPLFIYDEGNKVATYKSEVFSTELTLGSTFSNSTALGIKLGYENYSTNYDEGSHDYTDFEGSNQFAYLKPFIYFDTLDNKAFPSKGSSFSLQAFANEELKKNSNSNGFSGVFSFNFPVNQKLSFSFGGSFGKMSDDSIENTKLFRIGGSKNSEVSYSFTGLPIMGRYSDEFYIGSFGLKYNLTNSLYLLSTYNVLTYSDTELSFQKENRLWKDKEYGYGAGIGWDTFLGPMTFMISNNIDTTSPLFELYLGYLF